MRRPSPEGESCLKNLKFFRSAGSREAPGAGGREAPDESSRVAPFGGSRLAPFGGGHEAPGAGSREAPGGGGREAPIAGNSEAPGARDRGAPRGLVPRSSDEDEGLARAPEPLFVRVKRNFKEAIKNDFIYPDDPGSSIRCAIGPRPC